MTATRHKSDSATKRLFRNPSGQEEMFDKSLEEENELHQRQEVELLGRTFPNMAALRAHFLKQLRDRLEDPQFRETPRFPVGTIDDIVALSDPPLYTACR